MRLRKEQLLRKLIVNESMMMTLTMMKPTMKRNLKTVTVTETMRMRCGFAGVLSLKVVSVA